jgi:hypothetical protein
MENAEFNLKCLKTIDTKQGAVRAVRFNGKFAAQAFMILGRQNLKCRWKCFYLSPPERLNADFPLVLIFWNFPY